MKLELKHIVGYLPYGLKINLTRKFFERNNVDLIRSTFAYNNITKEYYIMRNSVTYGLEHIIPLLLPLSSLTKEIEHNGEKFVPIIKLYAISNGLNWAKEVSLGNTNTEWWCYHKNNINTVFGYNIDNGFYHRGLLEELVIVRNQLELWQKLYEWHFDIFGLIELGLALDKSKI